MNKKIICCVRIVVKVLLCLSLILSIGLLLNYIRNLNPTADGFDVTNLIARLVHGDDHWTWEGLTLGVTAALTSFGALFCADKIIDAIHAKANKK